MLIVEQWLHDVSCCQRTFEPSDSGAAAPPNGQGAEVSVIRAGTRRQWVAVYV